jgi:hypothetical protein
MRSRELMIAVATLVAVFLAFKVSGTQCDFKSQSYISGLAVASDQDTSNDSNWCIVHASFSIGQYLLNKVVQGYVLLTYELDNKLQMINTTWTATPDATKTRDSWKLIQYSNIDDQDLCFRESADGNEFKFPGKIDEDGYIEFTPGCPTEDQLRNPGIYWFQGVSKTSEIYTASCPETYPNSSSSSGSNSHWIPIVVGATVVLVLAVAGFFIYRRSKSRVQGYQSV